MATKLSILRSDIIFDKNITFTDLRVYAAICMYTNSITDKAFPHQETIAKKLQTSVSAVSRSVANLKKYKYISVEPKLDSNGRKIQNIYTVYYDISSEQNEVIKNDNSVKSGFITPDKCGFITSDNSLKNMNYLNSLTPLTLKTNKKQEVNAIESHNIKKQEEYLSLPEWQNLSEYEKQKIIQYINQRKEDHGKTIKNTPKAIKPILSAILELKSKDLTIDDIMANIQDKNGCVYQTIKVNYFDNVIKQKKIQNNTNSYQNEQSYQGTQNNAPKPALNDDTKSDNYFAYRFNEDIYVGFGFPECNELTESIEKQKPAYKKFARTLALIEWLKTKPNHELTQGIKKDIIDIYNNGGYDVFVQNVIKNNPSNRWVELLNLLNLK